ncbi:helix-turn-helix domain-containing protein [Priestia megaterium]|uniref:helix-turn-helix domain-containing protein n=1 Tax=Priestia megaterium TaxID=1404 RepID=UPI00203DD95B|nr:helix-turn-helix domain-containing protein [Priestia megaterium]MCM3196900.1 helix-turn-helix domain-containing protein [Priestia megaterium]
MMMNEQLFSLFIRVQEDPEAIEEIIQLFKPKMYKLLTQTSIQERDDLFQELSLALLSIICSYDASKIPNFYELRDKMKYS